MIALRDEFARHRGHLVSGQQRWSQSPCEAPAALHSPDPNQVPEGMLMLSGLLANPRLATRRALGRIQRRLIAVPESRVDLINGSVRFEHRHLSFLNEDDYRAMLTASYDIILCDFLERNLTPGDTVLDVGANVGYIAAVAASRVGSVGEVHSFEPLRECFA